MCVGGWVSHGTRVMVLLQRDRGGRVAATPRQTKGRESTGGRSPRPYGGGCASVRISARASVHATDLQPREPAYVRAYGLQEVLLQVQVCEGGEGPEALWQLGQVQEAEAQDLGGEGGAGGRGGAREEARGQGGGKCMSANGGREAKAQKLVGGWVGGQ